MAHWFWFCCICLIVGLYNVYQYTLYTVYTIYQYTVVELSNTQYPPPWPSDINCQATKDSLPKLFSNTHWHMWLGTCCWWSRWSWRTGLTASRSSTVRGARSTHSTYRWGFTHQAWQHVREQAKSEGESEKGMWSECYSYIWAGQEWGGEGGVDAAGQEPCEAQPGARWQVPPGGLHR